MENRFRTMIAAHPLLAGITTDRLDEALRLLHAEQRSYDKNETVLPRCEPMTRFGLVLNGAVQVETTDINGRRLVMAGVTAGDSFGEALHWLADPQRCDCIYISAVQAQTEILWLNAAELHRPQSSLAQQLAANLITVLSRRMLQMNDRVQALSKRCLRDKLITFLSQQCHYQGRDSFSISFDRAALADYLGCDRAALSRELSAMRADGLIDFDKNRFTVFHCDDQ